MKSLDYQKATMLLEKGIAGKHRTFEQTGVIVINLVLENQMDNDDFCGYIAPDECAVEVTMRDDVWGFGHIRKDNTIVDCGPIKFKIKRWEETKIKYTEYSNANYLLEKGIAKKHRTFEETGIIVINLEPCQDPDNDEFCGYVGPGDCAVEITRSNNVWGYGHIEINDNIVKCGPNKFRIKKWEEN